MRNLEITALSVSVTLLLCVVLYSLSIPNPAIFLFVIATYFTFQFGYRGGISSGLVIFAYCLFFFLAPMNMPGNTLTCVYKVINIIVSLSCLIWMVGYLHSQNDKKAQKLNMLAMYDNLTGLYNRNAFNSLSASIFQLMKRTKCPLTVLMADIDYFKQYNDEYGHLAGDAALRKVSGEMQKTARRSTDYLFRFGGEEFLIFLTNTDGQSGEKIAGQICAAVEKLGIEHKKSLANSHVTVSIGSYSNIPSLDDTIDEYIKRADMALYEAKKSGRNHVERYAGTQSQE